MNRFAFYSNIDKYKSVAHAGTYKYYQKIELPGGGTRYFYTKEEWDAYNNAKLTSESQHGRETAIKKSINDGRGYSEYNKYEAAAANIGPIKTLNNYSKEKASKIKKDIKNGALYEKHNTAITVAVKSIEKDFENKFEDRDDKTRHDLPEKYPFKKKFKSIHDDFYNIGEDTEKKLNMSYLKGGDMKDTASILKEYKETAFAQAEDELAKREKSIDAFNSMMKTANKYLTVIEDDIKELSNYEKRILADELGIDSFDDEGLFDKYGIKDSINDFEPGDDYGASQFEEQSKAIQEFWNDYKKAKKVLNSSKKDEDEDEEK